MMVFTAWVVTVGSSLRIGLLLALTVAPLLLPGLALGQSTCTTSQSTTTPQCPTEFDSTHNPPTGGRIWSPTTGSDFQSALNSASPGDIIILQAGATYPGNFTLPAKSGKAWIYIESSALGSLPAPSTRVSPAMAGAMPKLASPDTSPAVSTAATAHNYRFVGIEITTALSTTSSTLDNLVYVDAPGGATSLSQIPTYIFFERCFIHGTPTGNIRRGLAMNGGFVAVVDSYLSDFHENDADNQAIMGWNGPGPFKIVNNHLEAAAENVMFGGADPSIRNLVPSDIQIQYNHLFKPLSWRQGDPGYAGIAWWVKNLFELKNAQRALADSNVFEYVWEATDELGFAVQLTVRDQNGTAHWSVVQDVTFTNNIVRHAGAGVNILGPDYTHPSQLAQRFLNLQQPLRRYQQRHLGRVGPGDSALQWTRVSYFPQISPTISRHGVASGRRPLRPRAPCTRGLFARRFPAGVVAL